MCIQKATLKDLDSLAELFNFYRLFYKQESNIEGAKGFLKERLTNKESVIYIAFDKKQPIGFVQLYPSYSSVSMKRSWILNDLYIKESARKKGFAKKLMIQAIDFVKETGANGILLETCNKNLPAQRLYEKIGFERETAYFYYYSI